MRIEYSPTARALYLRLRAGRVAETVEVDEVVNVDLDADGAPLGIEFVHVDAFLAFLERRAGALDRPRHRAPG